MVGGGGGWQDSDAFLKVCGPSRITHKHIRHLLEDKQNQRGRCDVMWSSAADFYLFVYFCCFVFVFSFT